MEFVCKIVYNNIILHGILTPTPEDLAIQVIKGVQQPLALNSLLRDIDKGYVSYSKTLIRDIVKDIEEEVETTLTLTMINGKEALAKPLYNNPQSGDGAGEQKVQDPKRKKSLQGSGLMQKRWFTKWIES